MFFDLVPDKGLICAHRGVRSLAPENTILSLTMSRDSGAYCLETDVQLSKDEELILFHDNTLERTTNIVDSDQWKDEYPWRIDHLSLKELQRLDAGSWFLQTDPFGTVASGKVPERMYDQIKKQKIPLPCELLEWSKANNFPVNLEIKSLNTRPGDVKIVDRVMDLLQATGTMDLVLLSSFRHEYLLRAKTLYPQFPVAVLVDNQHPADLISYLKRYSAAAYHPNEAICDTALISRLCQAGIRVNCWTVNDMDRAEELLGAGAGIITDWPQRFTNTEKSL